MKYTAPNPDEPNVNVSSGHPLVEFGKLLGGLCLLILLGIVFINVSVDLAIRLVPTQLEEQINTLTSASTKRHGMPSKDERRVEKILYNLTQHMNAKASDMYTIEVNNDDDSINAISLPGGHMVIYKGLLDVATNDDELAFVIGHELGHYHNRDHLRGLSKQIVLSLLFAMFFQQHDISPIAQQVGGTGALQFSRQDEYTADAFGAKLTEQAGYDASKGIKFFTRLHSLPQGLDIFSTHPASASRQKKLDQLLKDTTQQANTNVG